MKLRKAKSIGMIALAVAAAAAMSITTAQAAVATLTDGGSTAWVDVDSSAGMYKWEVDGIDHLNQQWFWYRVGSGAQAPINALSAASVTQDAANKLLTTYSDGTFGLEIEYTLTYGGIGAADIDEGIKLNNFTGAPLSVSFYQYSDFNLLGTAGGDAVMMDETLAWQWKGDSVIAEGIIAPGASAFEANYTGLTTSTLYKLANQNSLVLSGTDQAGPGDVTWAFQWDITIPANGSEVITKDKLLNIYVVPEPSTLAFVSLGFAALLLRRRVQA